MGIPRDNEVEAMREKLYSDKPSEIDRLRTELAAKDTALRSVEEIIDHSNLTLIERQVVRDIIIRAIGRNKDELTGKTTVHHNTTGSGLHSNSAAHVSQQLNAAHAELAAKNEENETLSKRVAELEEYNEQLQAKLHCMCGSPIDHSSWEGHSAVSMYDYSLNEAIARAEQAEAERDAGREALEAVRPHIHTLNWNSEGEYEWLEIQINAALAPSEK